MRANSDSERGEWKKSEKRARTSKVFVVYGVATNENNTKEVVGRGRRIEGTA